MQSLLSTLIFFKDNNRISIYMHMTSGLRLLSQTQTIVLIHTFLCRQMSVAPLP